MGKLAKLPPTPCEVHPYEIEKLKTLLLEKSGASTEAPEVVNRKSHIPYLESYFGRLSAKTIVVENDYIDQDFLKDYSGYYVRCFRKYGPACTRLHFFQKSFDHSFFLTALGDGSLDPSKLGYIGFIVVKPLPETIIGRTCLKYVKEPDDDDDFILAILEIPANLFGIPFIVKTLAFQEQDKVVAACATSALWSSFQATGKLFQHQVLSPFEITRAATGRSPTEYRVFPNIEGINAAQMCEAMRSVGLEPHTSEIIKIGLFMEENRTPIFTKAMISAYLRLKIPVLMKIRLYNVKNKKLMENHAVAITGYHFGRKEPSPDDDTGTVLSASKIDRLYVHDDQVGPFAEMVYEMVPLEYRDESYEPVGLSTSLIDNSGANNNIKALPVIILVPLQPEIRIPFKFIYSVVSIFDSVLLCYVEELGEGWKGKKRLEWDIYLTSINDFKNSIFRYELDGIVRRNILLKKMPRFLWRATAYHLGKAVLDLIFDPTDIEQGDLFIQAVEYDRHLSKFLHMVADNAVGQLDKSKNREKIAAKIFSQFNTVS